MNTRAISLSLIIAGIAMFIVYTYIQGEKNKLTKEYGDMQAVVVATSDIAELEVIDDSKVGVEKVPQNFLAPGHFKASDISALYNTIALVPILKGEQITKTRIDHPGARTGLSRQVSIGKRAISISVNASQAVGRSIRPGDRVDLLAQVDYGAGRKDNISVKTVLQDVLVLSTGLSISNALPLVRVRGADKKSRNVKLNEFTSYNEVTLEVDPYQAQKITYLVSISARLYLTLRNNEDKKRVKIKGSGIFDILGEDASEARQFFKGQK